MIEVRVSNSLDNDGDRSIHTVEFHAMIGDTVIATRNIQLCYTARVDSPSVSVNILVQTTAVRPEALGMRGPMRTLSMRECTNANGDPDMDVKCDIGDRSLYDAYHEWYGTYVEQYSRGVVALHNKPPLTLNAYALIERAGAIGSYASDDPIEYVLRCNKGNYRYHVHDDVYLPYIREYSKLRGVLTVHSVYHPDEEQADTQPVAYPTASDMHFAMLECQPFADVMFEWNT